HGPAPLLLVHAELAIEPVHVPGVVEDQDDEGQDRPLLGEPEPDVGAADADALEHRPEDDAEAIGHQRPYRHADENDPEIGLPVGLRALLHRLTPLRWLTRLVCEPGSAPLPGRGRAWSEAVLHRGLDAPQVALAVVLEEPLAVGQLGADVEFRKW